MTPRRLVRLLLVAVIGAPVVQAVLFWTAGLLAAMGDDAAASVLGRINVGIGVAWLVALVGLVVAVAVTVANEPPRQ
jgi:hypothetical protein